MCFRVEGSETQIEPREVGDETEIGPCKGETDESPVEEVHGEGYTSHEDKCGVCEESF
jgi:hypothetical protein